MQDREQFDMQLTAPIRPTRRQRVSQVAAEEEGAAFMSFMAQHAATVRQ